jgi:hypothetical protein
MKIPPKHIAVQYIYYRSPKLKTIFLTDCALLQLLSIESKNGKVKQHPKQQQHKSATPHGLALEIRQPISQRPVYSFLQLPEQGAFDWADNTKKLLLAVQAGRDAGHRLLEALRLLAAVLPPHPYRVGKHLLQGIDQKG